MAAAKPVQPVNRYRVLRDCGDLRAGQVVTDDGWPFGRAAKLVEQRYLEPLPSKE